MNRVDTSELEKFLSMMGFGYRKIAENTLLTGGRLNIPWYEYVLPITIEASKHWVTVRGYIHRGVPDGQRPSVQALLSLINGKVRVVRFYLVEDCVVVQAEVRADGCDSALFADAFQVVARFARYHGLEIAVLASNPSVARGFDQVLAAERANECGIERSAIPGFDDLDLSVNRLVD